jgi:hypothetical protein
MMRICERCRKLGCVCAACGVVLFAAHDAHTHEDQKSGPPQARTISVAASTASTPGNLTWIAVPGTSKRFRVPT